jgi:hypothetical protein
MSPGIAIAIKVFVFVAEIKYSEGAAMFKDISRNNLSTEF